MEDTWGEDEPGPRALRKEGFRLPRHSYLSVGEQQGRLRLRQWARPMGTTWLAVVLRLFANSSLSRTAFMAAITRVHGKPSPLTEKVATLNI